MTAAALSTLRRQALLAALVLAPMAAVLVYAGTYLLDEEFQSTARVMPPSLYSAPPRVPIFANDVPGERMPDQQSVRYQSDIAMSVLKSTALLDAMVQQQQLVSHYGVTTPRAARDRLVQNTRVSSGRDGLLAIQVTDTSSPKAADIANAYVGALERYVLELTNASARARAEALRQQLAIADKRLRELDIAFVQVQQRTGIVKLSNEGAASSANLNDLRQRLATREAQLRAMSVYATPANPAYVRIEAEAIALRAQIASIVGTSRVSADSGRPGTEDEAQYQRALRDVRGAEETVDSLRKQLIQAEFESVSRLAGVQTIERAVPNEVRSAPRRSLSAAIAAVATLLVISLWFVWRLGLHRRFRLAEGSPAAP